MPDTQLVGDRGVFSFPAGREVYLWSRAPRPALGPSQLPVHWGGKANSTWSRPFNLYPVSRLRMGEATPPLPHIPSHRVGQLSFFFKTITVIKWGRMGFPGRVIRMLRQGIVLHIRIGWERRLGNLGLDKIEIIIKIGLREIGCEDVKRILWTAEDDFVPWI